MNHAPITASRQRHGARCLRGNDKVMARRSQILFEVEQPRVEIIPMIDVMMFLLIFFIMITLDMIPSSGILQTLPGKASVPARPATKLIVALSTSGEIRLNGAPSTAEALLESFQRAKAAEAQGAKIEILIAPDKQVNLRQIISIMDLARMASITAVGVGTRKDSAASEKGRVL